MAYANQDVKSATLNAIRNGMSQNKASKTYGPAIMTIRKWRRELGIEISYQITSLNTGHSTQHIVVEVVK